MTPQLPQSRTLRGIFSWPSSRSRRVEFIDLLRGWAVITMIHAHALNATLRPELTRTTFYGLLDFLNGLVAPAFLFGSGLVFAITARRKLRDYLRGGWPLARQVSRLLLLLLVGYLLHIPKFDLNHLLYESGDLAWQHFYQVDTLQCIAVTLFILLALLLIFRSETKVFIATAILTVFVVLVTPVIWSIDFWQVMPIPLAEYLNGRHNSLFPLFLWSAFIFAGAMAGFYFMRARERLGEDAGGRRAMSRLALAGVVLFASSFALDPLAEKLYPVYDYWHTSPSFFMAAG